MANQYINNMSDLWNSAGTTYTSIKMNVTNAASAVDSKLFQLLVGTVNRLSIDRDGALVAASTLTSAGLISSGTARPSANDSAALGASGTAWSDLYLASGGVINWDAADVTVTHTANQLIFAGAASGYSFSHTIQPTANDGSALGVSGTAWSDLYLATGAAIDYGAGNTVIAHSDAVLTVAPGDLRVTTAGTNTASVATLGGTQTLTSKTLTSPTINTATIASPTIVGSPIATAAQWTNLGRVLTCDIDGGSIDNVEIGLTTPASRIVATSLYSGVIDANTIYAATSVGAVLGSFNTVYGDKIRSGQIFEGTGTSVILSPAAGLNTIYLRPRGAADATGQVTVDNSGGISTNGGINVGGNLACTQNFVAVSAAAVLGTTSYGTVHIRPYGYGTATNESYFYGNGGLYTQFVYAVQPKNTVAHSFYNGSGPGGACHGALIHGNGSPSTAAGYFITYPDSTSYTLLGFHQPGINYWAVYASGPVLCSAGVWQASDIKLKDDIKDCDCHDAYDKLKAIRVKSYRRNDVMSRSGVDYDEMGFVAQELETVIPEAVMDIPVPRNDDKGFALEPTESLKATNDRTLLGVLWAAVQHQAELIERLEAKIEGKKT